MTLPISVIIRTKNEAKRIGMVLRRLKDQEYAGPVEVVLVDSGSTDETVAVARSFGCQIIGMKPEEFSFGRALNIGFAHAKGDIVINLSGHSVPVQRDYFTLMATPFGDRKVAATFGRDIPWPEACPSQARDIRNHFPDTGVDGSKFSNANAAIRKEVWEALPFNEDLPASEDLFWAREVMGRGYQIRYVPQAEVYHSHTSSPRYIFNRYLKERISVKKLLNLPDVTLKDVYYDTKWFVETDRVFVRKHGYSRKWLFHIPAYRLAQALGLYIGSKLADRREASG
ncbi:MAG: glycosyltransferase [Chloroflexota bacterium]